VNLYYYQDACISILVYIYIYIYSFTYLFYYFILDFLSINFKFNDFILQLILWHGSMNA
jgi:hypothetical protein